MKATRGFTLVELMIVVAIIAILSSIAISAYQDSVSKAQISEAFTTIDALKTDVANYEHQMGSCPGAGVGSILSPGSYRGKYVASAAVTGTGGICVITATMKSNSVSYKLRGTTVKFTMDPSSATARWSCSSTAPATYLPQTCR